jgi:hypothetical protein
MLIITTMRIFYEDLSHTSLFRAYLQDSVVEFGDVLYPSSSVMEMEIQCLKIFSLK